MSALTSQQQLLASLMKAGIMNQTLLTKADLQMSDLIGTDGYLVEEQAAQWIRRMIKPRVILPMMTVRTTTNPKYTEPKISYDGEVLRPAVDGQALTEAERVKPDFDDEEYEPVELIAETRFTRRQLEDNIERGNLQNVIREELTKAAGRDLEKIVLQGDTALPAGTMLSSWDGLIKTATLNLVPNVGTTLDKNVLRSLFKSMDDEFLDKSMAKFWVAPDAEEDYRDTIASRQTASGDIAFGGTTTNGSPPRIAYGNVEVMPIPLMPVNLGVGNDESVALLADPKNALLVWRRQMMLETEYSATARKWTVVLTLRVVAGWREKKAVAKATGLLVNAA